MGALDATSVAIQQGSETPKGTGNLGLYVSLLAQVTRLLRPRSNAAFLGCVGVDGGTQRANLVLALCACLVVSTPAWLTVGNRF